MRNQYFIIFVISYLLSAVNAFASTDNEIEKILSYKISSHQKAKKLIKKGYDLLNQDANLVLEYTDAANTQLKLSHGIDQNTNLSLLRLKAIAYGNLLDLKMCVKFHMERIKLLELIHPVSKDLATSYYEIACAFHELRHFQSRDEFLNKCEKLCMLKKYSKIYASLLLYKGNLYLSRSENKRALPYLLESYELVKTSDLKIATISISSYAIGHLKLGNYKEANNAIRKAKELGKKITEPYYYAFILSRSAELNSLQGKDNQSIRDMKECIGIWEASKSYSYLKNSYIELARAYKKIKNDSASIYYEKYFDVESKQNSINANRMVAEMEAKYNNAKRQKIISLLHKEKEISKLRNNRNRVLMFLALVGCTFFVGFALFLVKKINLIRSQSKVIELQKEVVESQKLSTEKKAKEIMDSIIYAERIQHAALPSAEYMNYAFLENFVIYKPKDKLSGDFYWISSISDDIKCIALGDSTGHGVPGAVLSIFGINYLNIGKHRDLTEPADFLNYLNDGFYSTFDTAENKIRDGIEISLLVYNKKLRQIKYTCAKSTFYILRNKEIIVIKGDKQPIGHDFQHLSPKSFTTRSVDVEIGDMVYLFTDGFPDQFGGPKNKKYNYKRFKNKLLSISSLPPSEQKIHLEKEFYQWKHREEQTDDISIVGIRIT